MNSKNCPVCGSTDVVYEQDSDELICRKCGEISIDSVKERDNPL